MRPRALTCALLLVGLVVATTSCDAGRPPAATVAGRDITTERLDDLVGAFVEADPETYGPQIEGAGDGTFQMSAVAAVLTTLVIQVAQAELAEREGARPTGDERTEAEGLVRTSFAAGADAAPDPTTGEPTAEAAQAQESSAAVFDALSKDTRDWLVELRATTLALARVAGEDATGTEEQARQVYESDPSAFESLCIRAIIVENPSVPDVQARLDGGEDLGAVSADVSIDPNVAAAEGSLGDCVSISQLPNFLPQEIIDVVTALDVGEVSDPVALPDGGTTAWFDVTDRRVPPFEDVQSEIAAGLPDPGEAALSELVQTSIGDIEVKIDPRFGTWHTGVDACRELLPDAPPAGACVVPPDGAG